MQQHYYSQIERHREEHQAFFRDFKELKNDLEFIQSNQRMADDLKKMFSNWANVHIKKTDKDLGRFSKNSLSCDQMN